MRSREGWTRLPDAPVRAGKNNKLYKYLVSFSRPCAHCGEPFVIRVTKRIADGEADSNSFGLRNCEKHRRNSCADPLADEVVMKNNVMTEELQGLYGTVANLTAEVTELRRRLAQYELPAAMKLQAEKTFPWT